VRYAPANQQVPVSTRIFVPVKPVKQKYSGMLPQTSRYLKRVSVRGLELLLVYGAFSY
jgi:hypothetical protein